jgi:hypothetical protein
MDQINFDTDSTNLLKQQLLPEASRLCNEIDKLERISDEHIAYYGYLKDFLVNSGSLCDEIRLAVQNNAVLLAMVGVRTLLEDVINVYYLKTKSTPEERMAVAADWFRISNDPEAIKNSLDGKSVKKRAEEADDDTKAIYNGEYGIFCNYTHSTATRGILNIPEHRTLGANKAALASIKAYTNIVGCIADIIDDTFTQEVKDAVRQYLDEYRVDVSEANLRLPS